MKCNLGSYFLFVLLCFNLLSSSAQSKGVETCSEDELMGWFREAKFGMFIHFGASTSEDYLEEGMNKAERYEASVHHFNPVDFDAKEWVRIAKDAGMKYIVFTTKHHDGFCKWDSKLTEWDVMDATPFKRDIVGELSEACKEAGLALGFYYSIADWYHPEYDPKYSNRKGFHFHPNPEADITKYMDFMYGQIEELCRNYQPQLFWFDGSSGFRDPNRKRLLGQQEMVDMLNAYGAICNSRLGDDDALKYVNYLSMGDNMVPAGNIACDFESAQTMNDNWHFKAGDENWKSAGLMLEKLVDIVGKGGNYLLNVGPDAKGVIPEASTERLKVMGEWLDKNGEAIYGTQAGPYPHELVWGSITQRQNNEKTTLYLNIVDWPKDGVFRLYGLQNDPINARLLDGGEELKVENTYDMAAGTSIISINVPIEAPDPYVSVIALEIAGQAVMEQKTLQQNDNSVILDVFQCQIHDQEYVPNKPLRPLDHRIFTVPQRGKGVMPARGLTVNGFTQVGQALSWDFRLIQGGKFKVAVVYSLPSDQALKLDGRLRATVGGQSVENKIKEADRWENIRMAHGNDFVSAILGEVVLDAAGMHTLSLAVSQEFKDADPNLAKVMLIPVD